jgi:hypothetical protein
MRLAVAALALSSSLPAALPAAPIDVFVRPRPLTQDELIMLRRPRNALQRAARAFVDLQAQQQRGPIARLQLPPLETGGSGRKWLPSGRIGLPPPAMSVGPTPYRPITASPMIVEMQNTMVSTGRGNEGMLVGLTIGLPWLLP